MRLERHTKSSTSEYHTAQCLLGLLLAIGSGCAGLSVSPSSTSDPAAAVRRPSMSRESFQQVLPLLQRLAPGDDLASIARLQKGYWEQSASGEKRSPIVVMPGWINSMSGGPIGGFYMFGQMIARSGDRIQGQHVFGYVWGVNNIAPQYVVTTEATTIDEAEFDRLDAQHVKGIGAVGNLRFRDLHVLDTHALPFRSVTEADAHHLKLEPIEDDFASFQTEQAFKDAETALLRLPRGTTRWDMWSELGALFLTMDYGGSHAILVKGFMSQQGDSLHSIETNEGIVDLRRFGYVENGQEVTKLVVVHRNDRLEKVVSYVGDDWRSYMGH